MTDKAIGVNLEDWMIVHGQRTGTSPWSPIAVAQVPVKQPAPSAPTILSVSAPQNSAGVLEIQVELPTTNTDGSALALAELTKIKLHHSTAPGVTENDPSVDFPVSGTLLWAPNDTETHYIRVRVQDSHGHWSELSNEVSGKANAALTPQEDSGLWAHRLGVESIFTNQSPAAGYVSWSNVVLYWKNNKYEIQDGNTNKKFIWWDYSLSTTTFQTSDTRPELDLEDVIVGYNDNGIWRLMCYQPTVMADYVRAGVLQSSNWGATAGSQLDLDAGTFKLGGSTSPKLSWDGATLSITGHVTIQSGSGIANLSDAGALATLDVVGTAQIQDAAITTAKIADLAVTNAKIADLAVTNAKIANAAISTAKIGDLAVTNAKIANLTITGGKIAASTITADKLSVSQLSAISADLGTVTAGSIISATYKTSSSYPYIALNDAGYGDYLVAKDSNGNTAAYIGSAGELYGRKFIVDYGGFNTAYSGWYTARGQGTISASTTVTLWTGAAMNIKAGIVGILNEGGAGDSYVIISDGTFTRYIYFDGGTTWPGGTNYHRALVVLPPTYGFMGNLTVQLHNTDTTSRPYYYSICYG